MKTQLLFSLLLGLIPLCASAQDCGCNDCQVPIIADRSRKFGLEVGGATFSQLGQNGQGVCSVEIDFAHDFISDLEISLTSPFGQTVRLVRSYAPADTTYFSRWKIKFVRCPDAPAPDPGFDPVFDANVDWPQKSTFKGAYLPSYGECLEDFDFGSVNGKWTLSVNSMGFRGVGFIYGFKINFCKMNGISCFGLTYEQGGGESCYQAEPFPTNYWDFVGNTAPYYPNGIGNFCGTIENDQWFTFINTCNDQVVFSVTPGYCINGSGIQIALYENCYDAPIACEVGCSSCGWQTQTIVAPVDPGKQYYILIDGFAGDQCDFVFSDAPSCLTDLEPPPFHQPPLEGCPGTSLTLGLSYIPFGAAGYIWTATNGALVNGKTIDTIAGPNNLTVQFSFGSSAGKICVQAYNFTSVSPSVCLPFDVDSLHFRVENATVCYDEYPFISQYYDYGVPPIFAAGTYHYTIEHFVDENGVEYKCPLVLEINLKEEGSFSNLPPVVALGSSYTLPTGEVVSSSGNYFWSENLPSGCRNDHVQPIYLIDRYGESDGCVPDTVTYILPGSLVVTCEGGTPPLISGVGAKKVVYNQPGVYDLSAILGSNTFIFADTVHIGMFPNVHADFGYSIDQNILSFNNLSQNADAYFWDFGDGSNSTAPNPTHTYSAPGDYIVTLTASGKCPEDQATQTIHVAGVLPQAAFQALPREGCTPLTVQYQQQSAGMPDVSFAWTFPGGTPASSTDADPMVSYPSPGVYPATLTVSNIFGTDTHTENTFITVHAPTQAAFSADVQAQYLTLSNLSQNATGYVWDFGDGSTATEASPAHAYAGAGTYLVTLVASGLCGSDTAQQWVEVIGQAPQAAFTLAPALGCVPLQVTFTDQSGHSPSAWQWEFPGGLPPSSTEQNPTVFYLNPGVFDATLTVENAFGSNTLVQTGVVSTAPLPTTAFTFTVAGLQVNLVEQSQNAEVCHWDFGDGQSDTASVNTHVYAAPGAYLVTLQCDNSCGSSILQQWVTVETSGTGEAGMDSHLRIMPNPSDGRFYLDFLDQPASQWYWQLFNTLGQRVAHQACGAFSGQYKGEIDLRQLPSGAYWLEVGTETRHQRVKLEVFGGH